MGLWTNNGLTLLATAVQTPGAQAALTYAGISPGCGVLATSLVGGTPYTAVALAAPLPATLASGQSLTVTDGTNMETMTVAAAGALAGATSIPINSFTPVHTYAAGAAGVCPTPSASDTALYNETQRVPVAAASAGGTPGESLVSAYFDGTQPTALYLLVGYFGGSGATGSTGTGTLMAEDIVVWSHTLNTDTFMYQADGII